MRIGIVAPSKLNYLQEINKNYKEILIELTKIVAKSENEIVVTPDKGSVSEYFAQEYIKNKGKKIWGILPLEDKEFGYGYVNINLGEKINCGTWRNQPEKFNEETDILLVLGYAVGGLIEMMYSKWFKSKPVYIVKELITAKLPNEINKSLDLRYISFKDFGKELKRLS